MTNDFLFLSVDSSSTNFCFLIRMLAKVSAGQVQPWPGSDFVSDWSGATLAGENLDSRSQAFESAKRISAS